MSWLFIAILTVILVEMVLRLPLISSTRTVSTTGRKAARIMAARAVSDHWKEKAVQAYAARMMKASLVLAGGLALVGLVGTLATAAADTVLPGVSDKFLSWPGLLLSLAVATVYVVLRQRVRRTR